MKETLLLVWLVLFVSPTLQQGQSLFFFMNNALLESPLIENNTIVYPLTEIENDLFPLNYAFLPSSNGGLGNIVGIAGSSYFFNDSLFLINYDRTSGVKLYVPLQNFWGEYLPSISKVAAVNPPTQELIFATSKFEHTANLTLINPLTGTYRFISLQNETELNDITSIQIDISAQIIYVLVDILEGYYPLIIEAYDAKSGEFLDSYNITSDYGEQLVSLQIDTQTGTLYGIEASHLNETYIVTIDMEKQSTNLVATIPGKFYSVNWVYQSATSTFYALYAGQVWTVTLKGEIEPFSLVPSDSINCAKGSWTTGPSTHQQQVSKQLVEPEMFYLFNVPFTDAWIDLNFSIQLLSHSLSTTQTPSINVMSPVEPKIGYATTGIMSCFPASSTFFIEQATTIYGQFVNLVDYATNAVINQVEISGDLFVQYDPRVAWNYKTNTTLLSMWDIDVPNVTWAMAFFELDNFAANAAPKMLFTFNANETLPSNWAFDPSTQTIFGMNSINATTLVSLQYPSGNINWKVDISNYSVWTDDSYGIALDSANQNIYLLICDNSTYDNLQCFFDGGAMSIVEINYSTTSASISSVTPVGTYDTVLTLAFSPSLGGVLFSTDNELLFYSTSTGQTTNIAPFPPGCADCLVLLDSI